MEKSKVESFLAHHGIKGMKWGKHKGPKAPPSADAAHATALKKRAKTGSVKSLSNVEIQDAINRMNLEQQFKRLTINEKPAVQRFVAKTLLEVGQTQVRTAATSVVKKAVG